jgi:hypothetical protein
MKRKSVRMEGRGCRICAGVNLSAEEDSREAETFPDISGSRMWLRTSFRSEVNLVDNMSSGIEEKMEANGRCSEYRAWTKKRSLVMLIDCAYARASCSCALSLKVRARVCMKSSTSLEQSNGDSYLKVSNHLADIQRRRAGSNTLH